jgi:hypothetical protein
LVLLRLSTLESGLERIAVRTDLALVGKRASAAGASPPLQWNTCNAPSAEDLRAIVREELASLESLSAPLNAVEAVTAIHDPAENDAAFGQATRLVDGAIAARVWGDDQALELRQLRRNLTPEQLDELNAKLIPAINRQEVRVDATMPF